ncbi:MAG: hypothetical protein JW810_03670 [Sedimentisphaerales bacterium]|nr:hypothetical protein [Sedimentisphaerales bacterium]
MESRLCTKCVLTATTPGIAFDEGGVCNYCRTYAPLAVAGEGELRAVLARYRNRGGPYDCMVCISGGRDSTYALWKLVHDYHMKVLAVNYRNPFTSPQARENIRRAVEILGVDFCDWEFPGDAHRRNTQKMLRVWSRRPTSTLIPIVCAHCKTTWPDFFRIARDHDISLIVIGSNPLETASFKQAGLGGARYYFKPSRLPRIIKKTFGEIVRNPRYLTQCSWGLVLKMYLCAGHNSPYLRRRYRDVRVIRLFDYLKWNEKEVLATITANLDWRKAPQVESSWRFDCQLDYARRIMYRDTVGVTELRDLFSKMIREGMMSRDEARERLKTEDEVPPAVADAVLGEMGLRLADLNLPAPLVPAGN